MLTREFLDILAQRGFRLYSNDIGYNLYYTQQRGAHWVTAKTEEELRTVVVSLIMGEEYPPGYKEYLPQRTEEENTIVGWRDGKVRVWQKEWGD